MHPPSPAPALPAHELLAVDARTHRPVHLALTEHGLAVVKEKSASSSSTLVVPYLNLLAVSVSHRALPSPSASADAASHLSNISIAALVPRNKGDSKSPLKLWTLNGTVYEVGGTDGHAQGGEGRKCAVDDWCKEAEDRAYAGLERRRRLHCIVNPAGGKGKAKEVWSDVVQPVFDAAGCSYDVSYTGPPASPTNATALGQQHDPRAYDALVAFSGDGIVHELLNGLATHRAGHGARALRETPIVHVPCGSGNALASSLYGPDKVGDPRWAALVALKGHPMPLDLSSLTQPGSSTRLFTFLTQAFGLMADLDLGTEHLRWMGDLRFTLGYIQGALARRTYPLTLAVHLVSGSKQRIAARHNAALGRARGASGELLPDDDDVPPLGLPRFADALPGPVKRRFEAIPSQEELDQLEEGWYEFDLTRDGVFFFYGGKVPFVAKDVMLFPAADPNDGLLDLVLVGPMGPIEALTAMDNAASGGLFAHPAVTYLKASSYRLSFPAPAAGKEGHVSIDGERVPYEPFQVEVHRGLARVLGMGAWEGSARIEGLDDARK
ncbi:hypothetical protein Rhopal_003679-T1 [Rhodotorula paludigena]|uniref:DAGKc domain-containing protein n=1 Tax=Rhodotorula paludigena TaxID=86838 RepID=A0AAV5GNT4_9BASI|nr:hypothetical protein Rhopal_003679-T1 [Rhodotorula paludigena]